MIVVNFFVVHSVCAYNVFIPFLNCHNCNYKALDGDSVGLVLLYSQNCCLNVKIWQC